MLLRALSLVVVLAIAAPALAEDAGAPFPYDWGVAYYMSYDNNLESCGEPIIDGIRKGMVSERTVAAVQADFTDKDGMRRITLSNGQKREETKIDTEDSALEDTAIEYLEWFVKTYRCKRYVVTFLNHGHTIDAMCADDAPGKSGKRFMSGKILGDKMRKLKAKFPGRFELFFLQQCGRGSLENLYSFRGTADYIMSSPIPVGAPNTYYEAFHRWLAKNPEATGDKCAETIAAEDEHYTIYTCLRTEKLGELPDRLDKALKPFLAKSRLAPAGRLRAIQPVGEPIVDAKLCLETLAKNNQIDPAPVAAFFEWTRKELFTYVRFKDGSERQRESLCGLSIFAPRSKEEAARYLGLDLLKESKLAQLWKRTLEPAPRGPY